MPDKIQKKILSPAKLNLNLRVLGKREDAYHEIASVMQRIDLFDQITITLDKGKGIHVITNDPRTGDMTDNLAYRAAKILLKHVDKYIGVTIFIKKNIPIGSGLGGGSSNAASVLKELNELLHLGLNTEDLMGIGLLIGSDVPFFLFDKGHCLARGRGERLTEIGPLPEWYYVLICPDLIVSTRWAYDNLRLTKGDIHIKKSSSLKGEIWYHNQSLLKKRDWIRDIGLDEFFINDLKRVVETRYPEIKKLCDALIQEGAQFASMTGSGPCVFGVFTEREEAYAAKSRLASVYGEGVFLARPI